ncbi:ASCH domain-containing protein [Legionella sp. km772]|uniref:ASCH domain-containing protein n=1 Tax=Legionella sp. km772 TaxID=2498111 RepID=UPI000F8DE968|nr:ASCH domain-containing protein [Legionella sp. km772]RUR05687.1 ASCH domain-containing protein [Legionella sp. km772]
MKVLLSIKPEYAEKIFEGKKQFEFRKIIPKTPGVTTIVIYATKPVGKVVGEFDIDSFLSETPSVLWSLTSDFAGISKRFFNEYFRGCATAHAIKISEVRRYEQPLSLTSVLSSGIAPQSFCYLT